MIPHGGLFSAKNQATLDSPKDFFNFVKACQALDNDKQKCQINLIEKDPKFIAQVRSYLSPNLFRSSVKYIMMNISKHDFQRERALKNLKRSCASGSDNVKAEPSPGATLSFDIVKNIQEICAHYHALPELTASNKVPVYMHPYKKGYFL
jgi:hypothetical protein